MIVVTNNDFLLVIIMLIALCLILFLFHIKYEANPCNNSIMNKLPITFTDCQYLSASKSYYICSNSAETQKLVNTATIQQQLNMTSSSSTTIITFNEDTQLSTPADLRRLTDTPGMTKMIKDTYRKIDLDETFESLIECGKMLQIALTASGNQPCSKDILLILNKYQNLVHDSTVTSHKFVNASIQAFQRHKDAIEILGFTEPEELVEMLPGVLGELVKCYDTATEMQREAGAAAANVDTVTILAESALISAKNDLGTNAQKKKEIQGQIDNMKAEEAANSVLLEKYTNAVKELGKEKHDAAKEAARARD